VFASRDRVPLFVTRGVLAPWKLNRTHLDEQAVLQ
jgi:hypothetical protein